MLRKVSFLLFSFLSLAGIAESQVLVVGGGPAGTSSGGGGTTITGGTCTNQFVKALNTAGVPTCVAITSNDIDSSIPTIAGTNTFTGRQDSSGAASTAPIKAGASTPGTCTAGKDLFFKTGASPVGQLLYACTSTNTWTLVGDGGGTTIVGGTCTNQFVKAIDTSGNITCATITSASVDTSIATTGGNINSSSQVVATTLTSPLPRSQGGLGAALVPGTAGNVIKSDGTNWLVGTPVAGGTCTNQVTTSISTLGAPTCTTVTSAYIDSSISTIAGTNTFTGRQDASGAASTAPIKSGTTLPGTCIAGKDIFYKTDATSGQNLYFCNTTNTWTQQLNSGSAGAPASATYITQTHDGTLSAEQALGDLATGILKNTITTGVLSIATSADLPQTLTGTSITTNGSITSPGYYRINCTCTVTLPDAVASGAGGTIAWRVIGGMPTIATVSSQTIGGGYGTARTTRIMVAGESANLESDGSNWFKISGESVALNVMLSRTSNGSTITAGTWTQVVMNNQVSGYAGMYDSTNGRATIIRPGIYNAFGGTNVSNIASASNFYTSIGLNAPNSSYATSQMPNSTGGSTTLSSTYSVQYSAAASDYIAIGNYIGSGGSSLVDVAFGVALPYLSVTEVSPW